MEWIIIGLLIYLGIDWIIAQEFYEIAYKKGYSERKYFWFSFLFGIVGYLMIIALPIQNAVDATDDDIDYDVETEKGPALYGNYPLQEFPENSGIKQCPNCGNCHDSEDELCPLCNYRYIV